MKNLFVVIYFIFILCHYSECSLQQVHIIFRHGDRTPDYRTYPNDPYANETFYPLGRGQLTIFGKQQEYKLGQKLRQIYDSFLGKIYIDDIIQARCTDYQRTQISLQLLLSGLWPPSSIQKWHADLNWLPIPYYYENRETDKIMKNILIDPMINEKYEELLQTNEVKSLLDSLGTLFKTVVYFSGEKVTTLVDLFFIYFAFLTQEKMGLLLPEWAYCVFPERLEKAVLLEYKLRSYDDEMLHLAAGGLFNKIKSDIESKMNERSKTKMFLYSGHEYNIVLVLSVLGVFQNNPHIPLYASYVAIELHKINNMYALKFYYSDYLSENLLPLTIPKCETMCPIDKFFQIISPITR